MLGGNLLRNEETGDCVDQDTLTMATCNFGSTATTCDVNQYWSAVPSSGHYYLAHQWDCLALDVDSGTIGSGDTYQVMMDAPCGDGDNEKYQRVKLLKFPHDDFWF